MTIHCSFTELLDPNKLRPNPKNPNRHSATQIALLAGILERAGWRQPITISARSGFVVRGHGRLEAALLLGFSQVPVDVQAYASDAEELADLVADNRLSELAELDEDALARVLRDLQGAGHDVQLAGFTEAEVARLLEGEVETDALETIPRMEIQAFESYDYFAFFFRDHRDFLRAMSLLKVGKVNYSISRKTPKIGIGRILDGKRLLALLDPHEEISVPSEPASAPVAENIPPPCIGPGGTRPGELVDPARHHEPGPGGADDHAQARPARHARRSRG